MTGASGPLRLAMIAEDRGHWDVGDLWIRACIREIEWATELDSAHLYEWLATSRDRQWFSRSDVRGDPQDTRRLHGRFGAPGGSLALVWTKRLLRLHEITRLQSEAQVVVMMEDTDGRKPTQAARELVRERSWPFGLVFGLPEPEVEAWVVTGFEAESDGERSAHRSVCRELGFDPVRNPSRMTSTHNESARDAKHVCRGLMGDDPGRRERAIIRAFQVGSVIAPSIGDFLREVREEIVSRLSGQRPRPAPTARSH